MRKTLRIISLVMTVVAAVFVFCALSCPTLGRTVYIAGHAFGAAQWRVCYAVYAAVTVILFAASFFVGKETKRK